MSDKLKFEEQLIKEERQRERVNRKNMSLVSKYRNRVASFVKDVSKTNIIPIINNKLFPNFSLLVLKLITYFFLRYWQAMD